MNSPNQNPNINPGASDLPSFLQLSQMSDSDLTKLFGVRDFYIYELDFATIVHGGGTQQNSFTVQTDSNFLWQQGCYFASIAGATQTSNSRVVPLVSFLIQDTSSGRQLSSGPVPIPSQFGNGTLPFVLQTPRFFRANTQVTVSLTNFDAAVDYDIKLSFIGTKFFKFAQSF